MTWLHTHAYLRLSVALTIPAGLALATFTTYAAGGSMSVYPHLFYIPVVVAAFLYRFWIGVPVALLAGLLCGPIMPLDVAAGIPQEPVLWLVRLGAFVGIALLAAGFSTVLRQRLHEQEEKVQLQKELLARLQQAHQELTQAYDTTLLGWSRALELRDLETQGHAERVTEMTVRLARAMQIQNKDELAHIYRGALLHDIGKMGVPDRILHKPGPLSQEELQIMRRHPEYAYELLSPIEFLRPALNIPYYHHERWDGRGYPCGLRGEEIPLAARIFAVVDVWDAMGSDRPYRRAWPTEQVREYIRNEAGKHFDPQVTEVFLAQRWFRFDGSYMGGK